MAAGLVGAKTAQGANAKTPDPEVYTRIGVRPFINCTATYTINGGSQMLPEVISMIAQACGSPIFRPTHNPAFLDDSPRLVIRESAGLGQERMLQA
jgi:hypothetical protein